MPVPPKPGGSPSRKRAKRSAGRISRSALKSPIGRRLISVTSFVPRYQRRTRAGLDAKQLATSLAPSRCHQRPNSLRRVEPICTLASLGRYRPHVENASPCGEYPTLPPASTYDVEARYKRRETLPPRARLSEQTGALPGSNDPVPLANVRLASRRGGTCVARRERR